MSSTATPPSPTTPPAANHKDAVTDLLDQLAEPSVTEPISVVWEELSDDVSGLPTALPESMVNVIRDAVRPAEGLGTANLWTGRDWAKAALTALAWGRAKPLATVGKSWLAKLGAEPADGEAGVRDLTATLYKKLLEPLKPGATGDRLSARQRALLAAFLARAAKDVGLALGEKAERRGLHETPEAFVGELLRRGLLEKGVSGGPGSVVTGWPEILDDSTRYRDGFWQELRDLIEPAGALALPAFAGALLVVALIIGLMVTWAQSSRRADEWQRLTEQLRSEFRIPAEAQTVDEYAKAIKTYKTERGAEVSKLTNEKKELSDQLAALRMEAEKLKTEKTDIDDRRTKALKLLEEERSKTANLQKSLDTKNEEAKTLRADLDKAREAVKIALAEGEKLKTELAAEKTKLADTEKALAAEKTRLAAATKELGEAKTKLADTEKVLSAEKTKLSDTEKVLSAEKTKLADTEKALAAEKTKLSDAEKALAAEKTRLAAATKELGEAKTKLSDTEKALAAEKTKLADTEKALSAEKTRLATATKELGEAKTKLSDTEKALAAEKTKLSDAEKAVVTEQGLKAAALEGKKKAEDAAKAAAADLEKANKSLKEALDKIKLLEEEIRKLKEAKDGAEKKAAAADKRVADAGAALAAAERSLTAETAKLATADKARGEAVTKLAAAEKLAADRAEALATAEAKLAALTEEVAKLTAAKTAAEKKAAVAANQSQEAAVALAAARKAAEQELTAAKSALGEATAEVTKLQAELKALRTRPLQTTPPPTPVETKPTETTPPATVGRGQNAANIDFLGASVRAILPEDRKALSLNDKVTGVIVHEVKAGSKAAMAGLKADDVIVNVQADFQVSPTNVTGLDEDISTLESLTAFVKRVASLTKDNKLKGWQIRTTDRVVKIPE